MNLKYMIMNLNSENMQKIYKNFRQPVFLFILSMTKNYDLSEDITEEVFIRIIKYYKSYNGLQNPKTWIFTIAKNTTYTFLKNNVEIPYEICDLEKMLNNNNKIKNEDSLIVEEYLSYLNDIERNIVILRIYGKLNCLEISKILKISHCSVRSKYSNALKKLKRRISKYE